MQGYCDVFFYGLFWSGRRQKNMFTCDVIKARKLNTSTLATWFITNFHTAPFPIRSMRKTSEENFSCWNAQSLIFDILLCFFRIFQPHGIFMVNLSCEIFGTCSYGGDALASSCALRHMNSCHVFHSKNSITYKYCKKSRSPELLSFWEEKIWQPSCRRQQSKNE